MPSTLPSPHVHAVGRDTGRSDNSATAGAGGDTGDGKVYLATHDGLFRYDRDGPVRVGPVIDLMGFTIAGPGRFFASGHPDAGVDLPSPAGLLESVDAGRTWVARSRGGQSDFHTLTASSAGVLGYDGGDGVLRSSADGSTWTALGIPGPPRSLSASPDGARTLATTAAGVLVSPDRGATWTRVAGSPLLLLTAWMDATTAIGVTPNGVVHVSEDQAVTWRPTNPTTGAGVAGSGVPQALSAAVVAGRPEVLLVTDRAIWRSTDAAATFAPLI